MRILFIAVSSFLCAHVNAQVRIYVHLDTAFHTSVSGRMLLFTSNDTIKGVPNSPDLSNPQPMYATFLKGLNRSNPGLIDNSAEAFSVPLNALKPGVYKIAGVIDGNPEERGSFNPGSYFSSKEARLEISKDGKGEAHLVLNKEAKRPFKESDSLKLLEMKSDLLSAFHKKNVQLKATVVLPSAWFTDTTASFPVVYIIPGWGGMHYDAQAANTRKRYGMNTGLPKIYVYLNPESQTPFGLHCFVDSRVNGPWGKALVEELMPVVRKKFRGSAESAKTFIVGQSSGGYAALWLPLHYPKAFGGGWSVSPDPVDFSNFSGIELYAKNANMYVNAKGEEIPFFIKDGKPLTSLKNAIAIESFEGDGGQFQSFEAEFGKPDKSGRPLQLFDRKTGKINPKVVKDWEEYDLGKFVAAHWPSLKALVGDRHLHVYAGDNDNFFLNKAVEAFALKAKQVNADIVVELFPGADHFTMWNPEFTARIQQEMDDLIQGSTSR